MHGRVKGIEILAEPKGVDLLAVILQRLAQRRSHAASFVAEQTEQADGGSAQLHRRLEQAATFAGAKQTDTPTIMTTRGQTTCPGLISRLSWNPIIAGRHEEQAGQHQPPRICLPTKQEAHDRKRKDGKKTRRRQDQSRLQRIVPK